MFNDSVELLNKGNGSPKKNIRKSAAISKHTVNTDDEGYIEDKTAGEGRKKPNKRVSSLFKDQKRTVKIGMIADNLNNQEETTTITIDSRRNSYGGIAMMQRGMME